MILALVFAYFGYKKANDSGRNGIVWALIALGVFIGSQLVAGLLIGVALGIGVALLSWPESIFEDYDILFRIIGIVVGIGGGYLVLKYLDRVPQAETFTAPPSPPEF